MKIKQCKHRQVPGRQLRKHSEHRQPFLWLSFFSSANLLSGQETAFEVSRIVLGVGKVS